MTTRKCVSLAAGFLLLLAAVVTTGCRGSAGGGKPRSARPEGAEADLAKSESGRASDVSHEPEKANPGESGAEIPDTKTTGSGSRREFCKRFSDRVNRCKEEFAKAALLGMSPEKQKAVAQLPPEERKELLKGTAELIARKLSSDSFFRECEKHATTEDVRALDQCMTRASCKAFAECVIEEVEEKD